MVVSVENADVQKVSVLQSNQIEIMIGDTEIDYNAAKLANCEFYAVKNGFRSEKFWKEKRVVFLEGIKGLKPF